VTLAKIIILDRFFDPNYGWQIFSRWFHVLTGITWIGLLYFFNFVQTPAFADMSPAARNEAMDKITWRALWWFRWAAALTFLTGLSLLGVQRYFHDFPSVFNAPRGLSIATGAILATTMFLNVWLVIWPAQQVVIGNARNVLAGGEADPNAAAAGKKGARASRCNTLFSISMLWFMVFTPHFSDFYDKGGGVAGSAGTRTVYWILFLVVSAFIELSALGLIGGYDSAFNKRAFDNHRNTIVAGFILWGILFIIGWEIILHP
jgi:uncharacterized membrane protein